MASDMRLNDKPIAKDGAYIYAEAADGSQVKISKADLATVVAGTVVEINGILGNNANVQPYTAWGNVDITEYISQYGELVSVTIVNDNSISAIIAKYSAKTKAIYLYSNEALEVTLRCIFRK